MIDTNLILKEIKDNGFYILKNFLSKEKCNFFVKQLNFIQAIRFKKNEFIGNSDNQVLYNYFIENDALLDFIYNENIFNIISKIIDEDYVLTSASARNKFFNKKLNAKDITSGIGWHTDGRYLTNNRRIKPSLSYFVIYLLEDFNIKNGATQYVPNSHKLSTRPIRNKNYNFKTFNAKAGSVLIMDTALYHRAGLSSSLSRWSIFNMYSSWFVKPYFQFNKMFTKNQLSNMSPKLKQMFHLDSTPPLNHKKHRATLKRVQNLKI